MKRLSSRLQTSVTVKRSALDSGTKTVDQTLDMSYSSDFYVLRILAESASDIYIMAKLSTLCYTTGSQRYHQNIDN